MLDGDAHGIEEHEDDDEPVEPLRLHRLSNPEPKALLVAPELRAGALVLHLRLDVGSSRES